MKIILVSVGTFQEYILDNIANLYLFNNKDITVITEKEYFAIKLTDGMYDEDNTKYLKVFDPTKRMRFKLPYVMHWADHMSTVVESQENTM